jgi:hypothetical protein
MAVTSLRVAIATHPYVPCSRSAELESKSTEPDSSTRHFTPSPVVALGLMTEYTIKYDSFIAIPFLVYVSSQFQLPPFLHTADSPGRMLSRHSVQPKFYAFSVLHTLNSRESLASKGSYTINTVSGIKENVERGTGGWMSRGGTKVSVRRGRGSAEGLG